MSLSEKVTLSEVRISFIDSNKGKVRLKDHKCCFWIEDKRMLEDFKEGDSGGTVRNEVWIETRMRVSYRYVTARSRRKLICLMIRLV